MADPVQGPPRRRVTWEPGDRLLASLARGARAPLAVVAVSSAVSCVAMLALPAVLASAVDEVLAGEGARTATAWLALLLVFTACAEIAAGVARAFAGATATVSLRLRLTSHILSLGVAETRRSPTGELVNRLVSNTATAGQVPVTAVGVAIGLTTSAGGVAALFVIDWRTGLTFVAGVPAAILLIRLFVARVSGLYDDYQGAQGRLAARLTDALAGIRTVRASGTADREITRILAPLPELSGAGYALWRAQARNVWQIALLLPLIEVAVLAVAGLGVAHGRLEPGELLAVAGYTALGLTFADQVDALTALAHSRSAARRICEVLGLPVPAAGTLPPVEGPGALSFRGVTVTRESTASLDDVDLEIPAGAMTAVVGRSGAGKSTLALLAGRLADPDRGQVLLDGRPLREIEPDALRRAVAYAFERPALLGGDLAAAISYGLPAVDREAVREAARAARIDDVIGRLPLGYDTPAGDVPLSGGELQRLGLARALVRGARLTVLDDATSGLDTATEAQVTRTLVEGMRGRTRLVVAHRVATAARADLVVWMEGGRVRARDTHRALWRDPAYRALFADPDPDTDTDGDTDGDTGDDIGGGAGAGAGETFPADQEETCPARS